MADRAVETVRAEELRLAKIRLGAAMDNHGKSASYTTAAADAYTLALSRFSAFVNSEVVPASSPVET